MKSKSNAMAWNFSRLFALSSPLLGVLVGLLAAFCPQSLKGNKR